MVPGPARALVLRLSLAYVVALGGCIALFPFAPSGSDGGADADADADADGDVDADGDGDVDADGDGDGDADFVCHPGASGTASCGLCGTHTRTCQDDGQWGPFNPCSGVGVCAPGSQEEVSCGPGPDNVENHVYRTCQDDCRWGPWSECG